MHLLKFSIVNEEDYIATEVIKCKPHCKETGDESESEDY